MKDKELKLNASGYYDETCYKAITAPPKAGEIWLHNVSGAYMLVIANQNTVYSTLRLTDKEKPDSIPVMCKTPMFTAPIMIGYCFEDTLSQYVKTVPSEEFEGIKKAIAGALGIHIEKPVETVKVDDNMERRNAELLEERDTLLDLNEALKHEMALMQNELEARDKARILLDESFEKVSREADKAGIYKEMYMTLLDKVISARGGKRK